MEQDQLERLKNKFLSEDLRTRFDAVHELLEVANDNILEFFITMLDKDDPRLRNAAAYGLRELADNRALKSLLNAINKSQNLNRNGTMVYALEKLDCSKKLSEIFDILFYQGYEAKMGAAAVLNEQIFEFSTQDLELIQAKWEDILLHPEKCPAFINTKDDIQNLVNGFLSYLNETDEN